MIELPPAYEEDKLREECGVFGIYAPGEPLPELTYQALQQLQHRGQQGAGISVADGTSLWMTHGPGLVRDAFARGAHLTGIPDGGILATGHTRYGTKKVSEAQRLRSLQPMLFNRNTVHNHAFTYATNGHVEDLEELAAQNGVDANGWSTDSELAKEIIGARYLVTDELQQALQEILPDFNGAYSSVLSTAKELIAARDPQGFRPLHLGKLAEKGWVIASEIAALDIVGAEAVREVVPGEIVTINEDGLHTVQFAEPRPAVCGFEYVYFSRPDNEIFGEGVVEARRKMGELLAVNDYIDADNVIGIPESGVAAATGYSRASGIPHEQDLVRNNYVDRSFIAPSQDERVQAVRNKINPIKRLIKGQRLVVVDDSIVRGTTTREIISMLREAGATELHVRISSPPYRWPCYYGMDTGRPDELIASRLSVDEIRDYIGADSLKFLTNEDMQIAVGTAAGKICTACTTGVYPTEVPVEFGH